MKTLNDLSIGTRVYYTGDMANNEARGEIMEHSTTRFGSQVRIEWDRESDGYQKDDSWISPASFNAGPGCRFILEAEYDAERKARMDAFLASARK